MILDHWHDMETDFQDELERRIELYRLLANAAVHAGRFAKNADLGGSKLAYALLMKRAIDIRDSLQVK